MERCSRESRKSSGSPRMDRDSALRSNLKDRFPVERHPKVYSKDLGRKSLRSGRHSMFLGDTSERYLRRLKRTIASSRTMILETFSLQRERKALLEQGLSRAEEEWMEDLLTERIPVQDELYYHNLRSGRTPLSCLSCGVPGINDCYIVNVVASADLPEACFDQKILTSRRPDFPCQWNNCGMKALNLQTEADPYSGTLRCFLFKTGKMVVEGATSPEHALTETISICTYITEKFFPCPHENFLVHNIVAVGNMGFHIDLEALQKSDLERLKCSIRNFPAVMIRPPERDVSAPFSAQEPEPGAQKKKKKKKKKKTVVLVFSTGMIVWTGVQSREVILNSMEMLQLTLTRFRATKDDLLQKKRSKNIPKSKWSTTMQTLLGSITSRDAEIAKKVQDGHARVKNDDYYKSMDLPAVVESTQREAQNKLQQAILFPTTDSSSSPFHPKPSLLFESNAIPAHEKERRTLTYLMQLTNAPSLES